MIFIKTKNTIQIRNKKCWLYIMIWLLTVTELFIRGRKIAITLVFIPQTHSADPRTIGLNSAHCFIMKISGKQELQQIAVNHLSDILTFFFYNDLHWN